MRPPVFIQGTGAVPVTEICVKEPEGHQGVDLYSTRCVPTPALNGARVFDAAAVAQTDGHIDEAPEGTSVTEP